MHVLDENVRQEDEGERLALEHLRAGSVADAIDWYRHHRRFVAIPTRDDALDAAIEGWAADLRAGHETVLLAWRRKDVAALNQRARQWCIHAGLVGGPEVEAPGGKRYAAGDRIVTLAPSGDGRFVNSERASVVRASDDVLVVRFDDGRHDVLQGDELGSDRLDHAYAVTVHRMQGTTVDRTHVFADGGGRELAYVAMSRARGASHVYVVADDSGQAAEDLTREWSTERRQRWLIDTDAPAEEGSPARPDLARRADLRLRQARLRAERHAVRAVTPDAVERLKALDLQLHPDQVVRRPEQKRGMGLG